MTTAAVTWGGSPPPLVCPDCGREIIPSLDHVLWDCEAFASRRGEGGCSRPRSALAVRLGWDST
eukprot:10463941-Alexandrium_andersonii.AAC.1